MTNKIIKNGISYEKNGWLYISVKGRPRERGYAYGYFCAPEFKKIQKMLRFMCDHEIGESWDFFIDATKKYFEENTFVSSNIEMKNILKNIIYNFINIIMDYLNTC